MSRRVAILVLLIVVLVGGAIALVVTARPPLVEDRDAVDARWAALRTPLADRYARLDGVATELSAAGAGERTYTVELADALEDWDGLLDEASAEPDAEAAAANRLEGLATRARVNIVASSRLRNNPAITAALEAFDLALVPPPAVDAYNRAVRRYEGTRSETAKRLTASLLGFDPRPTLQVVPS